jgi:23S rRNA (guanosine2251-2'-O)-methyltransferase
MANKPARAGAVRKGKKAPTKGSGGQGRQALEGRGPTPKAEDRTYHVAGKRKAAQERYAAAGGGRTHSRTSSNSGHPQTKRPIKPSHENEIVTGRNSVLEALQAHIPASTLYVATRIEMDDRVKKALSVATNRGIPILEITRPELDRLAGRDSVHQGLALTVPPYAYAHPVDLLEQTLNAGHTPLFVALDGITDPRNLGAIIRSTAAFGGHGIVVPQRRSVGVTASAWKTSAGAAARIPVAMAGNLTQTLKAFKERGVFVLGLDGGGNTSLFGLEFACHPIIIVVGSEGKGLSRLVTETCDAIISIPISSVTESLNAGIAVSVTLYEIARLRKN